jgi:predicted SnoaL-like aldol condensation-catalyzing enzyme
MKTTILISFCILLLSCSSEDKAKQELDKRLAANRKLMQNYHDEVWVKKNVDYSASVMSDTFISHTSQPGTPKGPEPVIQFLNSFYKAFPDLKDTQTHLIVDADYAVLGWEVTGTMTDSLWGMPPTGKAFKITGNDILKIENEKFVEHWFGLGQVMGSIFQQCGIPMNK